MTPQDLLRKENAKLQARIEDLEAELQYLKDELRQDLSNDLLLHLRARWPLEPGAVRLLGFLYSQRGKVVSSARLTALMYQGRAEPDTVSSVICIYVMKLRRMLGGDAILTLPRQGYRLSPHGVSLIDDLVQLPLDQVEPEMVVERTQHREGVPLTVRLLQKISDAGRPLDAREMLDVAGHTVAGRLSGTLTKMRDGGFLHAVKARGVAKRGYFNTYSLTPKGRDWLARHGKPST